MMRPFVNNLVLTFVVLVQVALAPYSVLAEEELVLEELVVLGSRAQPRSATDSTVPIDVISGDDLAKQGGSDLQDLLRNVVPSYNVNLQPISDAATVVRPANLRGLAPDHTLVLINGKRHHRASVIYWLGNGVSDGSQGPDISAIPYIALKQVEVLRDGAAAQYGSDAIAGVINFQLKEGAGNNSFEAKGGAYSQGDGELLSLAANLGAGSDESWVNFSFEYGSSGATDRSVQRNDASSLILAGNTDVADPAQIWGQPEVRDDIKFIANFASELSDSSKAYGHISFASKEVEGGFYFRNPNTRGSVFSTDGGKTLLIGDLTPDDGLDCPIVAVDNHVPDPIALDQVFQDPNCFSFQEMFPGGFTPRFGANVQDMSSVVGVKGTSMAEAMTWDLSASYGQHEADFFIFNTVNASLGPQTPTSFDPGTYIQTDTSFNFDTTYRVSELTSIASGIEFRTEEFEIVQGQLESYQISQPLASQGFSAASNGFSGFSDIAAGVFDRSNFAIYVEGEVVPADNWLLSIALRHEDFDDFGTTTNYKMATNITVNETLKIRGSYSTGFRAPTPGQQNAFNVSTEFDLELNDLVNNGTIPSTNPAAALVGGKPLEPEKSTNITLGAIAELDTFNITIDYFNIKVDDRLAPSILYSLTDQQVQQLIEAGVTSAGNLQNFRFFTNDFDTRTEGIDIIITAPLEIAEFNLAYNHTSTKVTKRNPETLDNTRVKELQEGLPNERWSLSANKQIGLLSLLGRLNYYGDWYDSEDGQSYEGKLLLDMELNFELSEQMGLTFGGQNILNTYPDKNPGAETGVGNKYSQFTPFGFNGSFLYTKLKLNF